MFRKPSKRQIAYREYLKSEHWEKLRAQALIRDENRCVVCDAEEFLQVHHKVYRGRLEDCTVADLETLCRTCHRQEHGIGPNKFDMKLRELQNKMNGNQFPSKDDERELVYLATFFDQSDETQRFFMNMAGMRIILTSSKMWGSWLRKDPHVRSRLRAWAEGKFQKIRKEIGE